MSANGMPIVLPDTLAGHWDTAEGREMAERYLAEDRRQLGKSELSDLALANAQYLEDISVGTVTFQSAIAMQTAAKERIRWLSAHLAAANVANAELLAALEAITRVRVQGHDNIWAGANRCREIAAAAISKATSRQPEESGDGRPHPDRLDTAY